jgi:probable addiction module antidote protein
MTKTKLKTTRWDVLDYLKDEDSIAAYLEAALEENDPQMLVVAIGDVAKARGINAMAKKMNVGRESLYKSFSGKTKPNFETVYRALDSFGLKISLAKKDVESACPVT